MLRLRHMSMGGAVLAAALLAPAAPAFAAPARPAAGLPAAASYLAASSSPAAVSSPAVSSPAGAPSRARSFLGPIPADSAITAPAPAARPGAAPRRAGFVSSMLGSDSCISDNAGMPFWCEATGWYAQYGVHVVGLDWAQGQTSWNGDYPSDATIKNQVNLPTEVSCYVGPTCMMVGLHYNNPRYSAQLVEVSSGNSVYTILNQKSPRGSTWSEQNDVSCASATFCMSVGQAGRSKKTSHGVVYSSHSTAYTWNGARLAALRPPAPAHARYSELAGVSCPATTECVAVGDYTDARGRWLTYADVWNNGAWQVERADGVKGERYPTFQAISCVSATQCMAVGDAYRPGSRAFAESWTNGSWAMSPAAAPANSGLIGVSCPTATACFASGWRANHALVQMWDGSAWVSQKTPVTGSPLRGDELAHVSCVTGDATECVAVGFRFNPRTRPGKRKYRTLAELWDGARWKLMTTYQ